MTTTDSIDFSPSEIAEGVRVCERATEGPLYALPPYRGCDEGTTDWTVFTDDDGAQEDLIAEFALSDDAKFFAHARTQYPRALREILRLRAALEEISQGKGEYNRDPLVHCSNTVDAMKALAANALDGKETPCPSD